VPATTPPATTTPPPTTTVPPVGVSKVLTIIEENHSLSQTYPTGMPLLDTWANRFAHASGYHALTHPSLPNYLGIADGSTFGISDDAKPSSHPISGASIFGQALTAGKTAKTYAESMGTTNCRQTDNGLYAVKHDPWAYSVDATERAGCNAFDVDMGTTSSGALHSDVVNGTLPNVGFAVPNLCNDAHNSGCLAQADSWVSAWLDQITAGPDWLSGRLAVVVTFDEDNNNQGNLVFTVVLHPSLDGTHRVVATALNHYALTGFYDRVAGAPLLRNAASARDMAADFGLVPAP
jgi:acid phosphatase